MNLSNARLAFALSLSVFAAVPEVARAQSVVEVEAQFEQGRALRSQRRDAEALALFRQLFDRTHTSRALSQMALAEAALGRWVDAEAHLVEAFALPIDDWMRANRAASINLDSVLATVRTHLGSLEVSSSTPGAELWIGERRVATLPLAHPARVVAGSVAFELRAPDRITLSRVVSITPGGLARESLELTPSAVAPRAVAATAVAAPTLRPSLSIATPHPSVAPRSTTSPLRIAAWASAGVGVGLLGVGAISAVVGSSAAARWNDDNRCNLDSGAYADGCTSDRDSAETMRSLAIGSFVAGGVLAATSAVLFAVTSRRRSERPVAAVCAPSVVGAGVVCEGRF